MSAAPRGPKEYRLGELSPDDFETLVFLLARAHDSRVVRIRQKDHGLDARLPTSAGHTVRGWQAKRFTGEIKWNECQTSVRRALAFWRPLRITFCFSKVLSAKEQAEFKTKLIDEFPLVQLDWWDRDELQARMRDTPAGERAARWAFEDHEDAMEAMRRAMAVGTELSNAGQAAARAAEIQRFITGRDPHLHYTVISRDADAPKQPFAVETVLSIEVDVEGTPIRFDAAERYPGAAADLGLGGRLNFSEDEVGRAARKALDRALAKGEALSLSSGVQADFDVPPGLKGLMPDGPVEGTIEIRPGDPIAAEAPASPAMPLLVRSGGIELGVMLTPAEARAGWDVAAIGAAGGLELLLSWRGPEGSESEMKWRWSSGEGTAREQLLAAQILLAAYEGQQVELLDPSREKVVVAATLNRADDDAATARLLHDIVEYLTLVAEAETWLGTPLEPPAAPTEDDLRTLQGLVSRIRRPDYSGTWTKIEVELSKALPDGGKGEWAFAFFQPLYADLFGARRFLGTERGHIKRGRISGSTGSEGPGDKVKVVPAQKVGKVDVHFYSPVELPEDAASRRPGPAHRPGGKTPG